MFIFQHNLPQICGGPRQYANSNPL